MTATPGDHGHDAPTPSQDEAAADDALRSVRADLAAIESADLADQAEIFERMHATLTAALDATARSAGQ